MIALLIVNFSAEDRYKMLSGTFKHNGEGTGTLDLSVQPRGCRTVQ